MKPWILYSLARLAIFAVLLAILIPLFGALPSPIRQVAATIVAAIIAFCISYLALGRLRGAVTASLAERGAVKRTPSADESAEDAAVDKSTPDAAVHTSTPDAAVHTSTPDAAVHTSTPDAAVHTSTPDAAVDERATVDDAAPAEDER